MLMILPATCALGQYVRFNCDERADPSKDKTYKWAEHSESPRLDAMTLGIPGQAVEEPPAKKGLSKTDAGDAGVVIADQATMNQSRELTSCNTGWGDGPGWRGRRYGRGGGPTTTTNTIYIGEVALDMSAAAKHGLARRGVVPKTVNPHEKQDKMKKRAQKRAGKLLRHDAPELKKKWKDYFSPVFFSERGRLGGASKSLKETSTLAVDWTGRPSSVAGVKRHWATASTALRSSPGSRGRRRRARKGTPCSLISRERATTPSMPFLRASSV